MNKKKAVILTAIIIASLMLCMILILGINALVGQTTVPDPTAATQPSASDSVANSDSNFTDKSTQNQANNKGAPAPAVQFANALCDEDYQTILHMLNLPDNSIVNTTNIQNFLQRSTVKPYLGADYIKIVKHQTNSNETTIVARIALRSDEQNQENTLDVKFTKTDDGFYQLGMQSAYAERNLLAPGGASVRINGKTLNPNDAKPYTKTKNGDDLNEGIVMYTLTCPRDNFDVYISTQLTDYTVTINFNDETTPYSALLDKTPQPILDTAIGKGMETLNQILAKLQAGEPLDTLMAPSADPKMVTQLQEWYQNNAQGHTDIKLIAFEPSDKEDQSSYISGNKTIHLYTRYTSTSTRLNKSGQHNGYMECILEIDHGEYKLVWTNLPSDVMFLNSMNQQWK